MVGFGLGWGGSWIGWAKTYYDPCGILEETLRIGDREAFFHPFEHVNAGSFGLTSRPSAYRVAGNIDEASPLVVDELHALPEQERYVEPIVATINVRKADLSFEFTRIGMYLPCDTHLGAMRVIPMKTIFSGAFLKCVFSRGKTPQSTSF